MPEHQTSSTNQLKPPAGFKFNPDLLMDYDEQVKTAVKEARYQAEYQAKPLPSFEGVPTLDITPTFNPTHAAADEIYARDKAPHFQQTGNSSPVEIWRIVDRSRLQDGTGLVASRILRNNQLGDVKGLDDPAHYATSHEDRTASDEASTPFVSFASDPEYLADRVILKQGFGVRDGRDSVVVRARVDPSRIVSRGARKEHHVLLVGGLAPDEYIAAYDIATFAEAALSTPESNVIHGDKATRDKALGRWALHQ